MSTIQDFQPSGSYTTQEIFGLSQLGTLGPHEPHPASWLQSAAAYLPTDGTRFSTSSLLSVRFFFLNST